MGNFLPMEEGGEGDGAPPLRGSSLLGLPASPSHISLEGTMARSSNPTRAAARYHGQGRRTLADDYSLPGEVLGAGGFCGNVVLAVGHADGRRYALKCFSKKLLPKMMLLMLKRESEIYLTLDHPNIARLCDVYEDANEVALVMECCEGGELFDRLRSRKEYSEIDAAQTAQQMLRAVAYLHAHGVVHRDIKLENFLYHSHDGGALLKLIDFGMAATWDASKPPMDTCCGTLGYTCPEMLRSDGYTSKCDMWSLGVVTFMLLTGRFAFAGGARAGAETMRSSILGGRILWQHLGGASDEAQDFVRSLLASDPSERMDASAALQHPWLLKMAHAAGKPSAPPLAEALKGLRRYSLTSRLRRAFLQLLVSELTPEETSELRELFLRLDRNNDGTIKLGDLMAAIGGHRPSIDFDPDTLTPTSKQHTSCNEMARLFGVLDANGDEEVYYSDFVAAAMDTRVQLRDGILRKVFARIDADGSGAISPEELRRAIGASFENTDAEVLLREAEVALDSRGELTYEAFVQLLEQR